MVRGNSKGAHALWEVRYGQVQKILKRVQAEMEYLPQSESRKLIGLWVADALEALK